MLTRQTRRVARRIDENAPPAAGSIATRSRSTATAGTNGGSTAIPVVKRDTTEAKPEAKKVDTKRRAALGEISSQVGKDKEKKVERRPLASTSTAQSLRRTTRSVESRTEAVVATKRKAGTTVPTRRPGITRGNSAVSTASGSTTVSNGTRRPLKETASLTEVGPATKRLRPSPDPEDVLEARYDEDNKELAVAPRPKDFGWTDLDAEDEGDPLMVSEYVTDAFKYMVEMEVSRRWNLLTAATYNA